MFLIALVFPCPVGHFMFIRSHCVLAPLFRSFFKTRLPINKFLTGHPLVEQAKKTKGRGRRGEEWKEKGCGEAEGATDEAVSARGGVPWCLSIYVHHLDIRKPGFRLSELLFSQLLPGVRPERLPGIMLA